MPINTSILSKLYSGIFASACLSIVNGDVPVRAPSHVSSANSVLPSPLSVEKLATSPSLKDPTSQSTPEQSPRHHFTLGTINVKSFGAMGDGIHDDTAAIQAAINSAKTGHETLTGGIVFLPRGRYRLTSTLMIDTDSITLIGEGQQNTELDCSSFKLKANGLEVRGGIFTKLRDFQIRRAPMDGIAILGSESGYSTYSHLEISNVRTSFNGRHGASFGRGHTSNLRDVFASHNSQDGFRFYGYNTSISMISCFADKNKSSGFQFNSASYCTLMSCASDNNGQGYSLVADSSRIIGFSFIACGAEKTQNTSFTFQTKGSGSIKGVSLTNCFVFKGNEAGIADRASFASFMTSEFSEIGGVKLQGCSEIGGNGKNSIIANGESITVGIEGNSLTKPVLHLNGAKLYTIP